MSKMNASAGLSGRGTMCLFAVVYALGIIEVAAQDESQHFFKQKTAYEILRSDWS
eukprot:COSAG05_NODE_21109_length_274_cov_0.788571_1_plen_54_part_01